MEPPMRHIEKSVELEQVEDNPLPKVNDEVVIDIVDEPCEPKEAQQLRTYTPPIPFLQRIAKAKMKHKYGKFIDILKRIHVNIPFLNVISEIPFYGKFLKELISKKRKVDEV
ncbi:hypothetical protein vseg_007310 [Gypsophila vaccaria]